MPFKNPHPLYSVWQAMRRRCRNPKFSQWKDYGGRGITICARWNKFETFLADMGERPPDHLLDRIDNDGNYEPANCRWVTHQASQSNRRITIRYVIEGKTYLLADLARMSGKKSDTIKARIATGKVTLAEIISPSRYVFTEGLKMGARISSMARKQRTHCKRGHEFTPENTGQQIGGRYCKACDTLRGRKGAGDHL